MSLMSLPKERPLVNSPSEHELLLKLQSGNIAVVDVLYTKYAEVFSRCAREKYKLPREDVQDIVHTTFEKLTKSIGSYDPERGGGTRWMWSIFRNVAMDILRKKPTEELTEDLIENVLQDESDDINPVEYTEEQEIREAALHAFSQLSEKDRKEILQGRGKRGQKRAALREAEEHLRQAFYEIYKFS